MRVEPPGVAALANGNDRHRHETLPPGPPTRKLTSHRCALWPGSYQAGLRQLLGQRYGQPDNCLPWASIADLTAMLRTAQTVQIRRSTLPCHIGQNRSRPTGRDRRSEEHTSELQSLMRNSYAVFCL